MNVRWFCWVRRAIQELHQYAADEIGVDAATRAEMERLLKNLQQLLVGISIMQVRIRCCQSCNFQESSLALSAAFCGSAV